MRRETRFVAYFFEECRAVPFFVARHLRQQQPFMVVAMDQQAVAPDADFLHVAHAAERRKHRDFVRKVAQFIRRDGTETSVADRGHHGHIAHRKIQRLHRRDIADAAAELSVLGERDERTALLFDGRQALRRAVEDLAIAHRGFHRLARDLQQRFFLRPGKRERRVLTLGMGRRLCQRHRAVSDHAAVVAGDVAGIGVMQQLSLVGAQSLGGDHDGYDRPSAAGLPDLRFQIARKIEVIVFLDGVQGFVVDSHALVVGVVVGQIGAGDDQGIGPLNELRQRRAERAAGIVALISHDDGHELELPDGPLQEGQLHFESVLQAVRRGRVSHARELDAGTHFRKLRREGLVHRNFAERGGIGRAVVHR